MKATQAIVLIAALITASSLHAQGLQNAIAGQVQDSSGAVIPGVKVTITNVARNVDSAAVTDEAGHYAVPGLVVGEYLVKAEAAGMKPVIERGVIVQANRVVRVDLTLTPGQINESVEVRS